MDALNSEDEKLPIYKDSITVVEVRENWILTFNRGKDVFCQCSIVTTHVRFTKCANLKVCCFDKAELMTF